MVKKINSDAIAIKALIKQGIKPINIAQILGISKQKVNYWRKTSVKTVQNRRKKLQKIILKKIDLRIRAYLELLEFIGKRE